ncbi:unnamed protein product [Orchesella dallaii]|uniref:ABC transporter domain-containing protein n=1 Tax=Orchesella dallaii TaxID=48710 RepID=A0ABP1QLV7_9HEXA
MRFEITDDGQAGQLIPFRIKAPDWKRKVQNDSTIFLSGDLKQRIAVKICDVVKCYKCDDEDLFALDKMSLDVYEGEMYALMGPSGAGKSTVLAAIMGLIRIDSGKVIVCGNDIMNGKPNSQFVSYMPQDGLEMPMYPDFTVYELFHFTGRQNGLTTYEVDRMIHFFERLMEFHDWEEPFKHLSAGKQKVVCLGSSIIHQPRVLVLDEPFIGVDYGVLPRMWNLIRILTNRETTILVVTHDVEQAAKADRVGLMGRGKMIVEGRPNDLLQKFGMLNLEDVFLNACLKDEASERRQQLRISQGNLMVDELNIKTPPKEEADLDCGDWNDAETNLVYSSKWSSWTTPIAALLYKHRINLQHFWLLFLVIICIPAIQNYIIMRTVGATPKIFVGVFNHELSEVDVACPVFNTCEEYRNAGLFSCLLMNFTASENFVYVYFKTEDEAKDAMINRPNLNLNLGFFRDLHARLSGYIGFNESFTNSFMRAMDDDDMTEDEYTAFQIHAAYDTTEPVLKQYFSRTMYAGYFKFAEFVKENCHYDSAVGSNIIEFQAPIFENIEFCGTYLASSALLGILWFFPIVSGSFNLITDRQSGAYTRSLLAGTKPVHMLIANCVRPLVYTTFQTLVWLFVLMVIEGVTIKGNGILLFVLSLGMGILGEIIGFIYGLLLSNHLEATIVILGTYVPVLMMSGIMWPIESISLEWVRTIQWCLPASLPAKAFREISHRGYDFTDERVYLGFISLAVWIIVAFLIFLIIARRDARVKP